MLAWVGFKSQRPNWFFSRLEHRVCRLLSFVFVQRASELAILACVSLNVWVRCCNTVTDKFLSY